MEKKDILKKSLLVGVGVAAFAQEKANKLVKELLKSGSLNAAEGKKLVRTVYQEAEKSGKRVAGVMQTELKRMVKLSGVTNTSTKKKTVRKKVSKKKK